MVPENCVHTFLKEVFSLSLTPKAADEVQRFLEHLDQPKKSSIPEVQKAFKDLSLLFSNETSVQFPKLMALVHTLESDAIEDIRSVSKTAGIVQKETAPTAPRVRDVSIPGSGDAQCTISLEEEVTALRQGFNKNLDLLIDALYTCHLTCRKIRGDGHCAFRAIMAWALSEASPDQLHDFMSQAIDEIQNSGPLKMLPVENIVNAAYDTLFAFEEHGRITIEQSDAFVHLLRIASIAGALKMVDSDGIPLPLISYNETAEQYVQRMSDMKGTPNGHGGQLEIQALMAMFKTQGQVIDLTNTAEPLKYAVGHLKTFVDSGRTEYLDYARDNFRNKYRKDLAQRVEEIKKALPADVKKRVQGLLEEITLSITRQANAQIERIKNEIQNLPPHSLILANGGNGHYDLLIKH